MGKSSCEPLGMFETLQIGLLHIGRCRMLSIKSMCVCVSLFHAHVDNIHTYYVHVCLLRRFLQLQIAYQRIYSGTKLMHGHAPERNWMKKTKDAGFIPGYVYKRRLFSPFGSHGHDQHPLKPCSIALQPVGSRSRALFALAPWNWTRII